MDLTSLAEPAIDRGLLPDILLRRGIRHLLATRAQELDGLSVEDQDERKMQVVASLRKSEIAIRTDAANEQHYEVPTDFFIHSLGPNLKYSCALFKSSTTTLEQAEIAMLDLYMQRAGMVDGMTLLDLGCWGSVSLYVASRFPNSKVLGLSNSSTQRMHILAQAKSRGLSNVEIITADINTFTDFGPGKRQFDRIISIEMFEHMKNYEALFDKVSSWLTPSSGRLFVHVFCHKNQPYHFETDEKNSWMAKYFFTGGTMPSLDLFCFFQKSLELVERWSVNGQNYAKTCEAWLVNQDNNKEAILKVFKDTYETDELAYAWFQRWRVFYIACAELFNYDNGREWFVAHYLFQPKA
ncbi:hypothetical protein SmJEL517_g05570 [Synchytrium microbalum]|uniref:Cyclopropane-fatty-acyl-phospholipid synthase n=1 Tax=Synchytrium microbalum TaxID=1806994 RepID=A0A507BUX2_9FUNG|nr:uncharacterized protein SmJEL517_g05570 [Synchytrium microbalum]TPX30991.1 hypothetical protein SmJEL517_g05570 [Synchytrium microbalum]